MGRIFPPILSVFIVGLGQILKGQGNKGLLLLFTFYFFFPITLQLIFLLGSGRRILIFISTALIVMPIIWIYSIIDALRP